MRKQAWRAAIMAAAICAAALPSWAATVAWKSNANGNMNEASNWTGGALPQDGDTLDMSVASGKNIYVGEGGFGDERRFETMKMGSFILRQDVLRLQYLTLSASQSLGLSSSVTLDVLGKIKFTTTGQLFGSCGGGTVVVDEIEHAGSGGMYMCTSASFDNNHLIVKTGKFTISNTGNMSFSTSTQNSGYGVKYVVGAGGLTFGSGAGSSSFYWNGNKNKVRIDPSADYTIGVNPARADNLAFMCHESTTYFGTTDYYDNTQPRTVTFAGGIGADQVSGRNVIVDGIGTLVFNACNSGSHEFNGALTVKDTAKLVLRDTAAPGKGTKTFNSGTTLKVEQTSPTGIVALKDSLTLAANSTLEFDLAENATTSALRVATLALPASGTVKVKLSETASGRYSLVENLPSGTTVDKFSAVNDSSASSYLSLHVEGDKLVGVISKKAIWKSNADGDLSVASNWVDDYVPQAGDTIDFRNVTARHSVYNDLTETVQYETVINHSNVMFRRREGCSDWCFAQVTFDQSGSNGGMGGGDDNNAARLTVAGRITLAGQYGLGVFGGNDIVTADEIVKTRSGDTYLVQGALRTNLSVFKARQFVQGGTSGFFALGTQSNSSNYGLDVVVGSGGFKTSGSLFFAVAYQTTVIHPSADYSFEANSHVDNVAMMLYAGSTLKIHTTDYNDGVTPRTVTLEGGVAARKSGSPYGKLQILGTGVVDFSSCRESSTVTMPATTVSDTATVLVRDTSIIGNGAMLFNSGTTLKVEQTNPDGMVELGGALSLAANSTLDFGLAANSTTSALKVASLTMPASGKVRVKVSGVSSRGNYVLIDNLPAGISAKQFEFVQKPFDGATLVVRNNQLMVGTSKGLVIIIAGGRTSVPTPVTAKILFAGDSTLDDHGRVVNPYASWGTTLEDYMRSGCSVDNYAKSGASTKSFRANGYWSSLLAAIRPGDFVGIQFGHNDQKAGSNFAAPDGLFRDNVRQFVSEVRALGGKPILLSPIVRGTFDDDGNLYETQLDNGTRLSQYATAMRELSVELGTDFVDMNALTHDLLVELGKEESAKLFAASAGKSGDYTHPIPAGADAFARLFVKNVKDRGLEVAALFS